VILEEDNQHNPGLAPCRQYAQRRGMRRPYMRGPYRSPNFPDELKKEEQDAQATECQHLLPHCLSGESQYHPGRQRGCQYHRLWYPLLQRYEYRDDGEYA
jgi:hypothetical protein